MQKRTDLDAKISSQFGQLLDELQSFYYHNHSHHHEFVQECLDAIEENARVGGTLFPEITIATVVTLDQFSRHHFSRRSLNEAETNIALLDEVCVTIVDRCLEKIDVTSSHSIDAKHLVFLLMPYRHTQKTLPKLKKIIECLDKRVRVGFGQSRIAEKVQEDYFAMLPRFRRKTVASRNERRDLGVF